MWCIYILYDLKCVILFLAIEFNLSASNELQFLLFSSIEQRITTYSCVCVYNFALQRFIFGVYCCAQYVCDWSSSAIAQAFIFRQIHDFVVINWKQFVIWMKVELYLELFFVFPSHILHSLILDFERKKLCDCVFKK